MTIESTNPQETVGSSASTQESNEATTPSWYEQVPEEYRESQSISSFKDKDFGEFIKDYANKDALVGRKGIILPQEGIDGDRDRFFNELGRPKEASEYSKLDFEIPEEIKDYVSLDRVEGFKEIAHKHGLSDEQFKGIVSEFMSGEISAIKNTYESMTKQAEEAKTTLRNEWGEKTDERISRAQELIDNFADESSYDFFNNNNKDVGLIRFLDSIAQKFGSDSITNGGQQKVTVSAEEVQARMNEILQDENYWVEMPTPGAKSLRKEYNELAKLLK